MDRFLEACGAIEPLRLEAEGPRPGRLRHWALPHPFALVGHAPPADVRLRHPQVSLRHAYLQLIGGRLACFDLGGRGGIVWPEGGLGRSGWIEAGGPIRIGPYEVRRPDEAVTNGPWGAAGEEGAARAQSDAVAPLSLRWQGGGPDVVLEFPDQSGGPVRWRASRVVTFVGRGPGCHVRLPDASVSWYHCALVRTPAGMWVVDLLSRTGLRLRGSRPRYGPLDDGDELGVGRFRIIVRLVPGGYRTYSGRARRVVLGLPGGVMGGEPDSGHAGAGNASALPQPSLPLPARAEAIETELVELLSAREGPAVTGSALALLVEQFGQMQQQMLDQFNQSLLWLMERLGHQQRAQMRLVRDEIDRLRLLSEELTALKEQVRQALPGAVGLNESALGPVSGVPARVDNGRRGEGGAAAAPVPRLKGLPSQKAASEVSEKPGPGPGGAAPAEDPLVMVSRRIAEIRGEQRTRWQKILDLVRAR
jgi:pSer/pThr/pTyr-binding forkhead associated (FHA) protein